MISNRRAKEKEYFQRNVDEKLPLMIKSIQRDFSGEILDPNVVAAGFFSPRRLETSTMALLLQLNMMDV